MTLARILIEAQQPQMEIPATWGQGRATYGGLVAAILLARLRAVVGTDLPLRSATISFVAPAEAGQATLHAEVLRQGKSVIQAEARLIQAGQVQTVLLASFGRARASSIEIAPSRSMIEMRQPTDVQAFPYIAGLMPEFLQHIDMRWAKGKPPFSGATRPDFAGWMRYQQPFEGFEISALLGLIDAWPPSVLPMYKTPAPASSLCWTVEFLDDISGYQSTDYWGYQVKTDAASEGYEHSEALIWDHAGKLVAISRQTVTIFA